MTDLSPPLQERSRATLQAISEATQILLETYTFEELTIGQIVKTAGSSTGSFYARFKSKEALLHYLHEDYAATGRAFIKRFVQANGPEPLDLEAFAERLVPPMILSHYESHGLLRAVTTKSFDNPQFARRDLDLVRWIAMTLSPIVVNSVGDREQHITNIALSLQDVTSILDRDLFYPTDNRRRMLTEDKLSRMTRIFIASLISTPTTK